MTRLHKRRFFIRATVGLFTLALVGDTAFSQNGFGGDKIVSKARAAARAQTAWAKLTFFQKTSAFEWKEFDRKTRRLLFRFTETGSDDNYYYLLDDSRDLSIALPKTHSKAHIKFPPHNEFRPWQDIGWGLDFKTGRVQRAGASANEYKVYAPPSFWGNWTVVGAHCGKGTFNIEVEPIGDTHVVGQVEYFNSAGKMVTEDFFKTTTVVVGDVYATVKVRLKGAGTGSSCVVTVKGYGA